MIYDLFLSHANKDKLPYVNELHKELLKLGINVFYDKDCIDWGDKWKENILNGTANSEFAIIVISGKFFGREWTEKELHDFLLRQNNLNQKIVLPLLYNVSPEQVIAEYPELEDIQYLETKKYNKKDIALSFAKQLIKRLRQNLPTEKPPLVIETKGTVDLLHINTNKCTLLAFDVILMNTSNENLFIRDIEAVFGGINGELVQNNKGYINLQSTRANRIITHTVQFTLKPLPIAIDGNSSKEISFLFEFSGKRIEETTFNFKVMTATSVHDFLLSVESN